MSEYRLDADGRHQVRSLVAGTEQEIVVSRKVGRPEVTPQTCRHCR